MAGLGKISPALRALFLGLFDDDGGVWGLELGPTDNEFVEYIFDRFLHFL